MSDEYIVRCDECGVVAPDGPADSRFGNEIAAAWYAGHHSAAEHPDAGYQIALPEKAPETPDAEGGE